MNFLALFQLHDLNANKSNQMKDAQKPSKFLKVQSKENFVDKLQQPTLIVQKSLNKSAAESGRFPNASNVFATPNTDPTQLLQQTPMAAQNDLNSPNETEMNKDKSLAASNVSSTCKVVVDPAQQLQQTSPAATNNLLSFIAKTVPLQQDNVGQSKPIRVQQEQNSEETSEPPAIIYQLADGRMLTESEMMKEGTDAIPTAHNEADNDAMPFLANIALKLSKVVENQRGLDRRLLKIEAGMGLILEALSVDGWKAPSMTNGPPGALACSFKLICTLDDLNTFEDKLKSSVFYTEKVRTTY